jgi:thioredoxin reductase (NADPH)
MSEERLDLAIIGAGPAGLAAAHAAARAGLDYLVLEKGFIAHTMFRYPLGRVVFSTPDELEFERGRLKPCGEKPTREELLSYYVQFALENNLRIQTEEQVISLARDGAEGFCVETKQGVYRAARVLATTGAMSWPRRLNVVGEDLPKVQHRFVEPYPFVRKDVLVVGGGNSAAEAALFLAQDGARATLAIWRADWEERDPKKGAIKSWVREPLETEIARGHLRVVTFTEIEEITESEVRLRRDDGASETLANDAVFVLIGHEPDFSLLRQIGVEFERDGGRVYPVYNPATFETGVPGLYVAGHFTRERHVKAAIEVSRRVVPLIAESLRAIAA